MDSIALQLDGMKCGGCIDHVKRALNSTPGVHEVSVQLNPQRAVVTFDRNLATPEQLCQAIVVGGFQVLDWEEERTTAILPPPVVDTTSTKAAPRGNVSAQRSTDANSHLPEAMHTAPKQLGTSEHATAGPSARSYWQVTGMHCSSCVAQVERAMGRVPGVSDIRVNLATQRASAHISQDCDDTTIANAISSVGYKATVLAAGASGLGSNTADVRREVHSWRNRAGFACLGLGLLLGGTRLLQPGQQTGWILALIATALLGYVGAPFYVNAIRRLTFGSANMDSLVALATAAAYLAGLYGITYGSSTMTFTDVGMILAFLSTGRYLESKAKDRATRSLYGLLELAPSDCLVGQGTEWTRTSTFEVPTGTQILIRPGDRIPLDAEVIEGSSQVDEAWLTGESIPRDKVPGDRLLAGTVNTFGSMQARVVHTADETTLAKVISLVQNAIESKTDVQRLADRVVAWFVPFVLIASAITLVCWIALVNQPTAALQHAVAVLIVACPCALGLATPTAVLVGSAMGAERGILIKNATALETAGALSSVVFDKTGTLTSGKPRVAQIEPAPGITEQQLLSLSCAVQQLTNHPVASAIVAHSPTVKSQLRATDLQLHPGQGISAKCENSVAFMGNEKLFRQHKISIPDASLQRATELCQQAQLVVFVAWQDRFWGLIGLEDQIRDAAEDVVGRLRQRGLKVIMVTGDNSKTANTIGKKLGIDEIVSEVLPADKQQVIENMQAAGHVVAMVGDGINDAPALATADLGVAVGSGADVSIEAADIVLTRDRLADVDRAIHLSRATLRTIRQNLVWAFVYNATLLPIAAGLIPGISLQPAWAAAAMACSSISVVTNSLMLRWR